MLDDAARPDEDADFAGLDRRMQWIIWPLVVLAGVLAFLHGVNPLVLAAFALMPWALLIMVFLGNGRFILFGPDGRTVMFGVLIPPMIIAMAAVQRYPMIDWRAPLGWMVGPALGFTLVGIMAHVSADGLRKLPSSPKRRGQWLLLPLIGAALHWGTLIDINAAVANPQPETQAVTIADAWVSHGKSSTFYFRFANAPQLGITNFVVSSAIYARAAPGDRVCLMINSGLFGWRWYRIADRDACSDPVWGYSSALRH